MEIEFLGQSGFSIKIKTAKLLVLPEGKLRVDGSDEPMMIAGPGEYEVRGFSITGFKDGAYLIEAEEIRLGYMTTTETVDVLLTDSWETAKETHPSLVIPIGKAAAERLIKASGLEPRKEKKLPVNKLNLPEETELVILER